MKPQRRFPIRQAACAAVVLLLAACDQAAAPPLEPLVDVAGAREIVESDFRQLLDQSWQRELSDSPITATFLGDRRYNDRWDDLSLPVIEMRRAEDQITLEKLGAMDRSQMSPARQLDYELFRLRLEDRVEAQAFREELMPMTPLDGVQLIAQIADFAPFDTVQDYNNWLARLESFGTLMDQTISLMKRGMAEGRMRPRVVMQRVLPQVAAQIVDDPTQSPFYAPFTRAPAPAGVPAAVLAQLGFAGQAAISETVVPAFQRLQQFLEKEYLPACPVAVGLSSLPDGERHYAWLIHHHTSTRLSAAEIHDLGIREVARIQSAMDAVMKRTGYKGSTARFHQFLRSSPRFRYTDSAQLLDAYRVIAKRIDPELPRLFGRLPRTPYGVRAIDPIAAPSAPAAYYYPPSADGARAGNFHANVDQPETRNTWEMEALTLHEAVPGHHLQIALAQELDDLPEFRRHGLRLTAYTEGWGLYAESLGSELGLYQDPYSEFGQLGFEMWRAVRLVVDTGLHAKNWTRKQALDYFQSRVPKSELEAGNEIDRYIAMPGQALAYKLGELKIRELRLRAQDQLGDQFDLRAFHDTVLGSGPLPLNLLDRQVEDWIAREAGKRPPR